MGLLPIPIAWQVKILKTVAPPVPLPVSSIYDGKSKLGMLLGEEFRREITGRTVIDFGCGYGLQTIEMVQAGAKLVIGVDIDRNHLAAASENARKAQVLHKCRFCERPDEQADIVVSLDCFEHYEDPAMILRLIHDLLKVGGALVTSWGPPWYHPKGMHLVELPPWTHVFFAEEAVVRWRQLMRGGSDTTYAQIGLNKMTVGRFEKLVKQSGFTVESLKVFPIRALKPLHNRWTREFTTSMVQAKLIKQ